MAEIATIGEQAAEFNFRLAGSEKVWRLPLMGSLPVKTARRLARLSDAGEGSDMFDAAIEVFDELCPGLTDEVTMSQLTEVMRAWNEASGVSVGE